MRKLEQEQKVEEYGIGNVGTKEAFYNIKWDVWEQFP